MDIDETRMLSEVTLKITGTLDIGRALMDTRDYLSAFLPLDEIILVRFREPDRELHLVIRVTRDGVTDRHNQYLFLLDRENRDSGQLKTDGAAVFPRSAIESALSPGDVRRRLAEMGLPPGADFLVLFDPPQGAGFIAVSYLADAYTAAHVSLFERLRDPFCAALSNAVAYTEIRQMRDRLADDSRLFKEATLCLTGEQHIGRALGAALSLLQQTIPVHQIVIVTAADRTADQRILLRVTGDGTVEDADSLLFSGTDQNFSAHRDQIILNLPDTFVTEVSEADFPYMSAREKEEKTRRLGIEPQDTLIMIGIKSALSAIVFACRARDPQTAERCRQVLGMLKEPFLIALYNALHFFELERNREHLEEDNRALLRDIQKETGDRVIGMDLGLRHVMQLAGQVARTPSPVLLTGETGSGKEVIANAIHRMSARAAGPFITLNCGAIPESLIDSELFGHERGAFTGANERKRGRFERADGGTLFLDEVGELPLSAQVRLLRVLQEREFERVGGSQVIACDVRLIAATNRDLPAMVREGRFREDLWFRLNVFPIDIPPLRERREDIPALCYHFIETKCRQLNLSIRPTLTAGALDALRAYNWPGNVRELQNAIERALILSRGEPLQFPHLRPGRTPATPPAGAGARGETVPTYDEMAARYLKMLLERTGGRISGPRGAAALAGMNPSTLRSKLKKLHLTPPGMHPRERIPK